MSKEAYRDKSEADKPSLRLTNGSRIGIVGGGPSGTFMAYFLLDLAERVGIEIQVDIYEKQDFLIMVRRVAIVVVELFRNLLFSIS